MPEALRAISLMWRTLAACSRVTIIENRCSQYCDGVRAAQLGRTKSEGSISPVRSLEDEGPEGEVNYLAVFLMLLHFRGLIRM
jgi:hypothetical protein